MDNNVSNGDDAEEVAPTPPRRSRAIRDVRDLVKAMEEEDMGVEQRLYAARNGNLRNRVTGVSVKQETTDCWCKD
jgi:hypothetical protein